MKNRLPILFCFGLLFSSFGSQLQNGKKYQNDLAAENLKGRVKSCTEFAYNVYKNDNKVDSDYYYKTVSAYDSEGKSTSSFLFNGPPNKRISMAFICTYDKNGRQYVIKDQDGKIIDSSVYTFNHKGDLVETSPLSYLGLKIVYNKAGRRDTMYSKNKGRYTLETIYHYNKDLDLTEEIWYKSNGKVDYIKTSSYNKNHQVVSESRLDSLGKVANRINYDHDEHGNVILEKDSEVFRIGGWGVYDSDPTIGPIHMLKYQYSNFDNNDNWLKEDAVHKDMPVKSIIRRIEYYK